ncbi:MAG: hypothetical protein EA412_06445 [Chitinophagaceae bacterium]|jgi:cytochrome c oxidase subunit 4|nr:MAG: hypothetical protein EA412_06445 [Chitinophagaceae bacterium]
MEYQEQEHQLPMKEEEYKHHVNAVWVTTAYLSVITIVEVAVALLYVAVLFPDAGASRLPLTIFVTIATIAKGYYIMNVFMHLKYEKSAMVLTIVLPFIFLVYAIIAFGLDGYSWNLLRNFWYD